MTEKQFNALLDALKLQNGLLALLLHKQMEGESPVAHEFREHAIKILKSLPPYLKDISMSPV